MKYSDCLQTAVYQIKHEISSQKLTWDFEPFLPQHCRNQRQNLVENWWNKEANGWCVQACQGPSFQWESPCGIVIQVYKTSSLAPEHCFGNKAGLLPWYVMLFLWRVVWHAQESLLPTLISLAGINFAGKIFH